MPLRAPPPLHVPNDDTVLFFTESQNKIIVAYDFESPPPFLRLHILNEIF